MGRSQDKLEKMQLRQSYRNVWQSDLMSTVTADTPYCCFSCLCGPCVSYLLRKRALYNDMSRYTCCGGYMPCSGRCGESKCPQFCLATEVFLCFGNSVASTRFMLQDEFNIHTTQCDNCIIGFMFCLNQIACIFSLVACIVGSDELSEASQLLSCLADMVYCTVCACMQTQHKIEMDKRDGVLGSQPMSVPPAQQMSRVDQPTPPYAGYPPATGYPQPYYPQPGHGYPPAPGYPPPGHGYPPAPGYPPPGHGYPPAPGYPPPGHGYPPAPDYPSK
ncbi:uncharacterized protein LOC111212362 [Brassica napus]|nr:PREDICTED: uncharacterized protein LOC106341196 [Brassica oleracea var. oleracea]XP_013746876.1 uncharacterized protein LOC106449695 [Brassica napus]XP_022569608.2 uncharacterized protein LOC111212362 [Brassica napus]